MANFKVKDKIKRNRITITIQQQNIDFIKSIGKSTSRTIDKLINNIRLENERNSNK